MPQQRNSTKVFFLLLSASLKLLFAFSCLINKGKTSTAGRWDNPSQCTRIISRPQQERRPAALTHSAPHHVWPSACQTHAPSRSPPGTDTQNRLKSDTCKHITTTHGMHTVCSCIVCVHNTHALTLTLHLTFHLPYHAIFSPWCVSLFHSVQRFTYLQSSSAAALLMHC